MGWVSGNKYLKLELLPTSSWPEEKKKSALFLGVKTSQAGKKTADPSVLH